MKNLYAKLTWLSCIITVFLLSSTNMMAQPANDLCDGAPVTNVPVDGTAVTLTGDGTGATDDLNAGAATVWESIVLDACADVTISFCETESVPEAVFIRLTDCPLTAAIDGDSDTLICANNNPSVVWTNVPAGTYYYPVIADAIFGGNGPYTLSVTATPCIVVEGPANDAACDALAIVVDADPISSTTTGATIDGPDGSCWYDGDPADNDVWYTFVAPESGSVTIETFDTGENDDTQVAVYSSSDGTCTGDLTEIGCNDDEPSGNTLMSLLGLNGLNAGETYWLQIDGYQGTQGAFDVSIIESITISVNEIVESAFDIFPNPTVGLVTISGTDAVDAVVVRNVLGASVMQVATDFDSTITLDLAGLENGVYFVEMQIDNVTHVSRVVKK